MYVIKIYTDRHRDIIRNGVRTGSEQIPLATGEAKGDRKRALRVMNYLRKRGHTYTFIQPV